MRYFTPELLAQLRSDDEATVRAAEAEWDRRLDLYEQEMRRIEPDLPEHMRQFNDLLLHDARVCILARRDAEFIMVLHKDIPPRNLVIVTYELTGDPVIHAEALPPETRSVVMDFDYDEFGLLHEGDQLHYTQSILFSNGWEMQLRFHDARFVLADPLFAMPGLASQPSPRLPQSA